MPHPPANFRRRSSPFDNRPLRRVPGEGPQPCRCMLIGEKPGKNEARIGRPFVGISGKYLDLCLSAANIDRQSIYITNLVKEFTDYSKPTADEIARDHEELVAEILACDPQVIGLVGGWATEHVLREGRAEMEKVHGVPRKVASLFGGELSWLGIVVPVLHPASADHAPQSLNLVLDDVLTLGKLLDGEIQPIVDLFPDEDDLDYRLVDGEGLAEILPW